MKAIKSRQTLTAAVAQFDKDLCRGGRVTALRWLAQTAAAAGRAIAHVLRATAHLKRREHRDAEDA